MKRIFMVLLLDTFLSSCASYRIRQKTDDDWKNMTVPEIQEILNSGIDMDKLEEEYGECLLNLACFNNTDINVIEELMNSGHNPNHCQLYAYYKNKAGNFQSLLNDTSKLIKKGYTPTTQDFDTLIELYPKEKKAIKKFFFKNIEQDLQGICKENWIVNSHGHCMSCQLPKIQFTDKSECDKCTDHIFFPDKRACIKLEGMKCNDNNDCNYEGYYCKSDGLIMNVFSKKLEPKKFCTKGYVCTNNKDCNKGSDSGDYYCHITDINADHIKNTYNNLSGLCQKKPPLPTPQKIENTLLYDMGEMSWWDADNICKAHGKRLFSVEEFQCYNPETGNLIKSGDSYSLCCDKGKRCTKDNDLSPVFEKFKKLYGSSFWIWTSSIAGEKKSKSLEMLAVILKYGNINTVPRDLNTNNCHAICQ